MTMMRSAMPISSSISDEMKRIARAGGDHLVDDLVDLVFRPDVDAARRLVEDEDRRRAQEPFRDHDFLLVAAGEGAHRGPVDRLGVDADAVRHAAGRLAERRRLAASGQSRSIARQARAGRCCR